MIKDVFTFLDTDCSGVITFDEFRMLDEENFRMLTLESIQDRLDKNERKRKMNK